MSLYGEERGRRRIVWGHVPHQMGPDASSSQVLGGSRASGIRNGHVRHRRRPCRPPQLMRRRHSDPQRARLSSNEVSAISRGSGRMPATDAPARYPNGRDHRGMRAVMSLAASCPDREGLRGTELSSTIPAGKTIQCAAQSKPVERRGRRAKGLPRPFAATLAWPPADRDIDAGGLFHVCRPAADTLHGRRFSGRHSCCSEQTRRKAGAQSYGATATHVATLAWPPALAANRRMGTWLPSVRHHASAEVRSMHEITRNQLRHVGLGDIRGWSS